MCDRLCFEREHTREFLKECPVELRFRYKQMLNDLELLTRNKLNFYVEDCYAHKKIKDEINNKTNILVLLSNNRMITWSEWLSFINDLRKSANEIIEESYNFKCEHYKYPFKWLSNTMIDSTIKCDSCFKFYMRRYDSYLHLLCYDMARNHDCELSMRHINFIQDKCKVNVVENFKFELTYE